MTFYLSHTQKAGLAAENWVKQKLEILGYDVAVPPNFFEENKDLIINYGYRKVPVEVKFASQRKFWRNNRQYPRWSWRVDTVTGINDTLLILVADDDKGNRYPFVMPGSVMENRSHFEINSHPTKYKGMMACFLENWEVIPFIVGQDYTDPRQMDLFHQDLEERSCD